MNTNDSKGLSGGSDILLEEYKILVDLVKHYHERRDDSNRTFLTANTIIATACSLIIEAYPGNPILCVLCLLGALVSVVWFLVGERIALDSSVRFFQLRSIEEHLGRTDGIFTRGHAFFFKREALPGPGGKEPMKFPRGIEGVLSSFRAVWAGIVLPSLFILLYLYLALTFYHI
jgi:hypothetical protein